MTQLGHPLKLNLMIRVAVLLSIAALALSSPALFAATTNLISSADAGIVSSAPDNNTGGNSFVAAGADGSGPRRGLFWFDVAGVIPAGATINSVTLTLTVPSGNTANPSTFDLFRVLADWGEGDNTGSSGSLADTGEVTWNSRHHGQDLWNTPGGDYVPSVSASTLVSGLGTYTWSSATLAADVQLWRDAPATNFGWILISQLEGTPQTARRFGSREDPPNAPVLTIDYTVVPEPSSALLVLVGFVLLAGVGYLPDRRFHNRVGSHGSRG